MKHYILLSAVLLFAANLFAQTWTKHPVSTTLPATSKILYIDPANKVWVGGPGIWLSVWDGKQWTSETRPEDLPVADKDLYVTAMVVDARNNPILGTNKGVICQNKWQSHDRGQYIMSVANYQDEIYVLDKKEINLIRDGHSPTDLHPPTPCNFDKKSPKPIPTRILWDKQHQNIWANTNAIAISTYKGTWRSFEKTENARDITLTPDGRLAFVSQSGQLCFFNKNNDSLFTYTVRFKNKTPLVLQSATAAPDGSWWFTTNGTKAYFYSVDKLIGKSLKLESVISMASCDGGDWAEPVPYIDDSNMIIPEYPGGVNKMYEYLRTNMIYPEAAKSNKVQGTVGVSFNVQKDGSLTDIFIVKDIGSGCAEEAIRLVKSMPNWIPGRVKGRVDVINFKLPIRFKIE